MAFHFISVPAPAEMMLTLIFQNLFFVTLSGSQVSDIRSLAKFMNDVSEYWNFNSVTVLGYKGKED